MSALLTPNQLALKMGIADAVVRECHDQIEYHSEWLGYLPFGCYHWVTCNHNEIKMDLTVAWSLDDLLVLERCGFLVKTSEESDPDDETRRTILYHVRSALPANEAG